MKNYTPNFSDPRVQLRCQLALNFCEKYVRSHKPQWLSSRWISHKDHFGMNNNKLSRYLRENLLICISEKYNKDQGICKTYRLNQEGFDFIKDHITIYTQTTYSVIQVGDELKKQLVTGDFVYNDTSSRLYNPIQNLPKASKKRILTEYGYKHHYDIQCAAPTLLLQYAQQLPDPMDLWLPAINEYLKDRKIIRQRLADQCEVDVQVIKRLINAMFQGGHISKYSKSSCYDELEGDIARIEFLKQDPFIIALKQDIRVLWTYIKPSLPKRTKINKTGNEQVLPISGRRKTALYRDLERRVLDQVQTYLRDNSMRYLLEHDGWSCERELNLTDLRDYIKNTCSYDLIFDYEMSV